MIRLLILSIAIFLQLAAGEKESTLDVQDIVRHLDELYRSESSYAEMEMVIVTPHWQRTLKMKAWSQGMDKTFIRILAPAKDQGVATLRIKNEMWNYLPKINKVIKVPPSMMMSSWMGSDFTNDDLVKEFTWTDDYHFALIRPEDAQDDLLYLQMTPKENLAVVWGSVIVAVQQQGFLPVWEKYYDEKGELMRLIHFKEIKTLGGRTIPTVLELIPQDKEGQTTIIRYLDARFNAGVADGIFTLRNLQSGQ
ncbi:outer membrane lipoprotein-sorting protein [candidate division KSB1 bacterium]|nr:outer membrane lipoprotein-sorting protein [candidate division KSB1 bacterium]RQW11501.1 MAG: outer membrane lipoprotein-sorting protein [candidate division KSB1 bacterium]